MTELDRLRAYVGQLEKRIAALEKRLTEQRTGIPAAELLERMREATKAKRVGKGRTE
jgi:uncharacterized coiled-coil protein SlyX